MLLQKARKIRQVVQPHEVVVDAALHIDSYLPPAVGDLVAVQK